MMNIGYTKDDDRLLQIALCDDNGQHNRFLFQLLVSLIEKNGWKAEIAHQLSATQDMLRYAQRHQGNHLYFLDLDFGCEAEMDGLALARAIRQFDAASYIVYISAHAEYLPLCYNTKASDFLLKPLSSAQLEQCMEGILRDIHLQQTQEVLHISLGSQEHFLPQADIFYFEKQREYVIAHYRGGSLRWRESFDSLLRRLRSSFFCRTHKGYVVQRTAVQAYYRSKRALLLTDGATVPVSRKHKEELEKWLIEPGITA